MVKQSIIEREDAICLVFTLPATVYNSCIKELADQNCPNIQLRVVNQPIKMSVTSLPKSQYRPNSYYYTNFRATFTFFACEQSDSLANQGRLINFLERTQ